MIDLAWKHRYIFWPFVRVLAGLLLVFALADGWWNARSAVGPGGLWVYVLPLSLMLLWLLVRLRPWLRYLREDHTNGGGRSGYGSFYVLALVATGALTGLLDSYLGQALAPVAVLTEAAQIRQRPPARFYRLGRASINPRLFGRDSTVEHPKGGHPRVRFHMVTPLLPSPADTIILTPPAWLGFAYTEDFEPDSAAESPASLEAVCQRLRTRFVRSRPADLLAFEYLERADADADAEAYLLAAEHSAVYRNPGNTVAVPLVLLPRYTPFGRHAADKLLYLLGACLAGPGLFWLNLSLKEAKTKEELEAD